MPRGVLLPCPHWASESATGLPGHQTYVHASMLLPLRGGFCAGSVHESRIPTTNPGAHVWICDFGCICFCVGTPSRAIDVSTEVVPHVIWNVVSPRESLRSRRLGVWLGGVVVLSSRIGKFTYFQLDPLHNRWPWGCLRVGGIIVHGGVVVAQGLLCCIHALPPAHVPGGFSTQVE